MSWATAATSFLRSSSWHSPQRCQTACSTVTRQAASMTSTVVMAETRPRRVRNECAQQACQVAGGVCDLEPSNRGTHAHVEREQRSSVLASRLWLLFAFVARVAAARALRSNYAICYNSARKKSAVQLGPFSPGIRSFPYSSYRSLPIYLRPKARQEGRFGGYPTLCYGQNYSSYSVYF